jgi:hypothetical protein
MASGLSEGRTGYRRRAKKAIVPVARQFAVDLWRIRTGQLKPEQLGLSI